MLIMYCSLYANVQDYLETKRLVFPRFYFLSNDELLDILAQSKNYNVVQVGTYSLLSSNTFLIGRSTRTRQSLLFFHSCLTVWMQWSLLRPTVFCVRRNVSIMAFFVFFQYRIKHNSLELVVCLQKVAFPTV